jgi:hypothetical protein
VNRDEHIDLARRNHIFCTSSMPFATCPHRDWVATVGFYAALHVVWGRFDQAANPLGLVRSRAAEAAQDPPH